MSNEIALTWDVGKFEFQRKLGNFVQYFQVNLPTNGYGVPMKIVDPLLLAEGILNAETTDDVPDTVVDRAIISVEFEEGLPIIDGTPIWERFDGEPLEYYKLFKEYREALYSVGSRAIAKLAAMFNIAGRNLNVLAKVYHWQLRCRAYDAHRAMERARKRQFEIEKLESKHMKAADTLLEQAMTYLEQHPEQMNPKVAVQMLQVAMKAGRLAVGLNAEKPGSTDSGPNINIQQTASGAVGEMHTRVEVEQDKQPGAQDVSQLQSILHILDKSGALDKARVVDADYSVIDDAVDPVESV